MPPLMRRTLTVANPVSPYAPHLLKHWRYVSVICCCHIVFKPEFLFRFITSILVIHEKKNSEEEIDAGYGFQD